MPPSSAPARPYQKKIRRLAALVRRALKGKPHSVSGVTRIQDGAQFMIREKRGDGAVWVRSVKSYTDDSFSVNLFTSRKEADFGESSPFKPPTAKLEIPSASDRIDVDEKELLASAIASFAYKYLSTEAD